MKRLYQAAAIGAAASAIFAVLLAWEIVANAQNPSGPPKAANPTATTITVDPTDPHNFAPLTADSPPALVVNLFLDALRQGNKDEAKKMLTETARKKCEEA